MILCENVTFSNNITQSLVTKKYIELLPDKIHFTSYNRCFCDKTAEALVEGVSQFRKVKLHPSLKITLL